MLKQNEILLKRLEKEERKENAFLMSEKHTRESLLKQNEASNTSVNEDSVSKSTESEVLDENLESQRDEKSSIVQELRSTISSLRQQNIHCNLKLKKTTKWYLLWKRCSILRQQGSKCSN